MSIRILRGASLLLAAIALFLGTMAVAAEPDARTLIEQAIVAQGGMKALELVGATYSSTKGIAAKGTYSESDESLFKCETLASPPELLRQTWNIETGGNPVRLITVLQGDHGWDRILDKATDLTEPEVKQKQVNLYLAKVRSLVPLLRESGFMFQMEAASKVNERPATVLLVSKKNEPDIHLYFDQTSHLLVKIQYTTFEPDLKKNARFEEYLDDYRPLDGLENDRKVLANAKLSMDAATLRTLLRKQVLNAPEQAQARKQVKALGDDKFSVREDAKNALIKMGPRVVPLLEEASHSPDAEISASARECLQSLGKGASPNELIAALHVYLSLHDSEAFDLLMAYLPATGDDPIGKEVRAALVGLASMNPKAKATMLAAASSGDASLKKALAFVVTSSGLKDDVGYRVYPIGLKQPMKWTQLRDGKKIAEWEVTDMRFYHSLPASMFTKP